jgi:hypothetical protein
MTDVNYEKHEHSQHHLMAAIRALHHGGLQGV